jgi:hypothetical protein
MEALFRGLMLVFMITGLAFSATSVGAQPSGAQQLISQLLFGVNPQWVQIPGAPGVQYAPNANADLFRYENRYYYQHEGSWYRGSNFNGPWQRVQDVPRRFHQIEAPYFRQPPGWAKGNKAGWKGDNLPPGQRKKYDGGKQAYKEYKHDSKQTYKEYKKEYKPEGGKHAYEGQKNKHEGGHGGQKNQHGH